MDKRLRFMTGLIAPLKVEPGSEVRLSRAPSNLRSKSQAGSESLSAVSVASSGSSQPGCRLPPGSCCPGSSALAVLVIGCSPGTLRLSIISIARSWQDCEDSAGWA
jgi:hypothetical protein